MANMLVVGTGYLGERIARLWQADGERVFTTTRRVGRAQEFAQQGFEPVVCDVLDAHSLQGLPTVDTVVTCVGFDRSAGNTMRSVYVEGLANVLRALGDRAARWVHVSSTGVYGQTDGELVDETAPTVPLDDSGTVVLEAERMLHEHRPDAIILRFAGIYGPGRLLARAQSLRAGEPFVGDGSRWLNLIHVEDGAEVVKRLAQRGEAGAIYNVCDDRSCSPGCTRQEFYGKLAQLLDAPPPRFVPPTPGTPLPGRQRANRRINNQRLRQELGVPLLYPGFEEGLPVSV